MRLRCRNDGLLKKASYRSVAVTALKGGPHRLKPVPLSCSQVDPGGSVIAGVLFSSHFAVYAAIYELVA